MRKILHIDMDAYYASIEQRDRPELAGRPVIVGSPPDRRGVVAAASYEARKFGVRSAMSSRMAGRLCPQGVFLPPDFEKYKAESRRIMAIFAEASDLVEPLSLDEAYLDVTSNKLNQPLAREVARYLRRRIHEETGLTASAGVGPSKLIAKIASDFRKPNGMTVVPPERVEQFLGPLPVEKIPGVGPVTARKFHAHGIRTIDDMRRLGPATMHQLFGRAGRYFFDLAHGIDQREVCPSRTRKSVGSEHTFEHDITDAEQVTRALQAQVERACTRMARHRFRARTVHLKVRYADFHTITRACTVREHACDAQVLFAVAHALMQNASEVGRRPVRLIGVSFSGFDQPEKSRQRTLAFEECVK